MRKLLFFILISSITLANISCASKRNLDNFTIISYGISAISVDGLDYKNGEAFSRVAQRWGITFKSNGCIINNSLRRKIEKNNREAIANIERKFGKDWKQKFNEEVKKELEKLNN